MPSYPATDPFALRQKIKALSGLPITGRLTPAQQATIPTTEAGLMNKLAELTRLADLRNKKYGSTGTGTGAGTGVGGGGTGGTAGGAGTGGGSGTGTTKQTDPFDYTTNFDPGGGGGGGGMATEYSVEDIVNLISQGVDCDTLPPVAKQACKIAKDLINAKSAKQGTNQNNQTTTNGNGTASACPKGSVKIGGKCYAPGDMFPGGDPGVFTAGGQTQVGAFGMPALTPTLTQPIVLRCPRGFRLGIDNLCYPKAVLGARSDWRKHKAPRRPPMTGAEAAALRRLGTLQRKVKKLAGIAGYTCGSRGRGRRK